MQDYVMFGIMGIFVGVICILDMRMCKAKYAKRMVRCSERAVGTVVSEKTSLGGHGWRLYTVHSAEVIFETRDGKDVTKETCRHKEQRYQTGDKVTVLYDPNEPVVCIFPSDDEEKTLQTTAALSYGMGFLFLGLGLILAMGSLLSIS